MFRSFNSHESMRRGGSWNIFSLGASGAGLPFHTHGETWLGVLYGAKRWALYPPEMCVEVAKRSKHSCVRDLEVEGSSDTSLGRGSSCVWVIVYAQGGSMVGLEIDCPLNLKAFASLSSCRTCAREANRLSLLRARVFC